MRAYYDRRAAEYDDWWLGTGLFAERQRPAWSQEVGRLVELVAGLDGEFDRVFTSHFYGHLLPRERKAFVREARRVGRRLVVADAALRPDVDAELWQERVLNDGSRHRVFKRFFAGPELAEELGGGAVLHEGDWFVVIQSPRD